MSYMVHLTKKLICSYMSYMVHLTKKLICSYMSLYGSFNKKTYMFLYGSKKILFFNNK